MALPTGSSFSIQIPQVLQLQKMPNSKCVSVPSTAVCCESWVTRKAQRRRIGSFELCGDTGAGDTRIVSRPKYRYTYRDTYHHTMYRDQCIAIRDTYHDATSGTSRYANAA